MNIANARLDKMSIMGIATFFVNLSTSQEDIDERFVYEVLYDGSVQIYTTGDLTELFPGDWGVFKSVEVKTVNIPNTDHKSDTIQAMWPELKIHRGLI